MFAQPNKNKIDPLAWTVRDKATKDCSCGLVKRKSTLWVRKAENTALVPEQTIFTASRKKIESGNHRIHKEKSKSTRQDPSLLQEQHTEIYFLPGSVFQRTNFMRTG